MPADNYVRGTWEARAVFRFARKVPWRLIAHKLWALLALIAYTATAIGFPAPVYSGKDRSQPFICQNHICGCRDAHDCWEHCCCYSPEEKLAWARGQGMEPPTYAEMGPSRGWNDIRLRDREQMKAEASTCDQCTARAKERTACSDGKAGSRSPHCTDREAGQKSGKGAGQLPCRSHSGFAFNILKCRGFSTTWVSSGVLVAPPMRFTWTPSLVQGDELSYVDCLAIILDTIPPDPPPRCA